MQPQPSILTYTPFTSSNVPFTHTWKILRLPPQHLNPSFPFSVSLPSKCKLLHINYIEFRSPAPSPPPADIGNPGDIWICICPGEFGVYSKGIARSGLPRDVDGAGVIAQPVMGGGGEWQKWSGAYKNAPQSADRAPILHPYFSKYCLWCTVRNIGWYSANHADQNLWAKRKPFRERILLGGYAVDGGEERRMRSAREVVRVVLLAEALNTGVKVEMVEMGEVSGVSGEASVLGSKKPKEKGRAKKRDKGRIDTMHWGKVEDVTHTLPPAPTTAVDTVPSGSRKSNRQARLRPRPRDGGGDGAANEASTSRQEAVPISSPAANDPAANAAVSANSENTNGGSDLRTAPTAPPQSFEQLISSALSESELGLSSTGMSDVKDNLIATLAQGINYLLIQRKQLITSLFKAEERAAFAEAKLLDTRTPAPVAQAQLQNSTPLLPEPTQTAPGPTLTGNSTPSTSAPGPPAGPSPSASHPPEVAPFHPPPPCEPRSSDKDSASPPDVLPSSQPASKRPRANSVEQHQILEADMAGHPPKHKRRKKIMHLCGGQDASPKGILSNHPTVVKHEESESSIAPPLPEISEVLLDILFFRGSEPDAVYYCRICAFRNIPTHFASRDSPAALVAHCHQVHLEDSRILGAASEEKQEETRRALRALDEKRRGTMVG